MTLDRFWTALALALAASAALSNSAAAQSSKAVLITQIGPNAVCRSETGARIAPAIRPAVPMPAELGADSRAHLVVNALDCYLNASEFTLETSANEKCSSARIAGPAPRLAGTRSIAAAAPHCDD